MRSSSSVWPIVLAGGEGRRMQSFIRSWLGEERPKQYCAFSGRRSMLGHTWDRARAMAPPDQVTTIVGRGHLQFLDGIEEPAPGAVIEQPGLGNARLDLEGAARPHPGHEAPARARPHALGDGVGQGASSCQPRSSLPATPRRRPSSCRRITSSIPRRTSSPWPKPHAAKRPSSQGDW